MKFDLFVLPFTFGLVFLMGYLAYKYASWFIQLEKSEKSKVIRGFFSLLLFRALKEIFFESLLHRRIIKKNRLLGYMHMSLAFGWFLLIVVGNLESRIYQPTEMNPPYIPIFFRFFNTNPGVFPLHRVFSFLMDLLLLFVLTGVLLAWIKRMYSKMYGMKRTTKLMPGDRFALASLWLIFPFRLLAEGFTTAAFGGGDFFTTPVGHLLGSFLPVQYLYYPAWWAYSLSLGVFFAALPFSRYMHIPTEVVLIFSRHFGLAESDNRTSFTEIEVNSCSRCGICIDTCQLSFAGGIHNVQSTYQLKSIRYDNIHHNEMLNCLMCGRCEAVCPVGIDILKVRQIARYGLNGKPADASFSRQLMPDTRKADVIYFAGCMSHQTPSIKRAMEFLFREAGVNYWFMDEQGGLCCGRPMMLAGHKEQANIMIRNNRDLISKSGAKLLVTSCPICYKVFKNDYNLDIKIMHHTQYLNELVERKKINILPLSDVAVYHDPCELSRELKVYHEPRQLLDKVVNRKPVLHEKDDSLCCGGSLANLSASNEQRSLVARDAYLKMTSGGSQLMITSCPKCKKTFEMVAENQVKDIAEIVYKANRKYNQQMLITKQKKAVSERDNIVVY